MKLSHQYELGYPTTSDRIQLSFSSADCDPQHLVIKQATDLVIFYSKFDKPRKESSSYHTMFSLLFLDFYFIEALFSIAQSHKAMNFFGSLHFVNQLYMQWANHQNQCIFWVFSFTLLLKKIIISKGNRYANYCYTQLEIHIL